MEHLLPVVGFALIAAAFLQFGLWTGRGLRLRRLDKQRFEIDLAKLRAELHAITHQPTHASEPVCDSGSLHATDEQPAQLTASGTWKGFRPFIVTRMVRETSHCTSIYLTPTDGKGLADFRPGQHIALRVRLPGFDKPLVRCYSLSDTPKPESYRITVKRLPHPNQGSAHAGGVVSNYLHQDLQVGDALDVKAPRGSFVLQESRSPAILLAGGIGITPLLSMFNSIAESENGRDCLMIYGVRNGQDHAFHQHLENLSQKHANLHVINCFSSPSPEDQMGVDYQSKGFVTIDMLKQGLRGKDYEFYLCGPPSFMQVLYKDLKNWGISDSQIHYESFGTASLCRQPMPSVVAQDSTPSVEIRLSSSDRQATFDCAAESNLLEWIEEQGIDIESGCRTGNCGTCQIPLLAGRVVYTDTEQIECDPGFCLPCVAKPAEAIEIGV
ncbi:MAG: FAD-binding oxidoreductase [Pirellulaceae bacterium]|nr:FAD-binding oxidoreductase [Pirellulaceae bacterium]